VFWAQKKNERKKGISLNISIMKQKLQKKRRKKEEKTNFFCEETAFYLKKLIILLRNLAFIIRLLFFFIFLYWPMDLYTYLLVVEFGRPKKIIFLAISML